MSALRRTFIGCLLVLLFAGCASGAIVSISFTNSIGQPDTNAVKLIPVARPIMANGGFSTAGPGIISYPNTNGWTTNWLSSGAWLVTNSFLGQGILFAVPTTTNSYVLGVNLQPISGFNLFNYTPGVNLITSTNASVNVTTGPFGVVDLSISNISVTLAASAVYATNAGIAATATNSIYAGL